ncbi:MAG: HlyD family efflux transporter periplasmic adaptor subunit [Planctomycetaceae bacterium]|nr:HlyD family efflux transporter periplasmic adaptor subunit [Planctomycetaceae bacterium]
MSVPEPQMSPQEFFQAVRTHIEGLARQPIPRETFFGELLEVLARATNAVGGMMWMQTGGGVAPICDAGGTAAKLQTFPHVWSAHGEWVPNVVGTGESRVVLADDEKWKGAGGAAVLLFIPFFEGKRPVGAVELVIRPETPPETRNGLLEFVEQLCGLASRALSQGPGAAANGRPPGPAKGAAGPTASPGAAGPRGPVVTVAPAGGGGTSAAPNAGGPITLGNVMSAPAPAASNNFWQELEQFLLVLERAETVTEIAATAAADARLMLDADRLSVVVKRGEATNVEAVSGQKTVNHKGDLIRSLVELAKVVLPTGEPLDFSSRNATFPPTIEEKLTDFLEKANARRLLIVPLFANQRPEPPDETRKDKVVEKPRKVIGGLVVEQMREDAANDMLTNRTLLLADHVGAAISNGLLREQVFLLPLWIRIGRAWEWFHGRRAQKAGLFAGAAFIALLLMVFVPWEYRVEGEGKLMPTVQQRVFAPWDGDIVELSVHGGERVAVGDPLLKLRNNELHSQRITAETQLLEKRQLERSLQSRLDTLGAANRDERIKLEGQLEQTRVEIIGLYEQAKILNEREEALSVHSPRPGVIATFQVEQLLMNRPVKRGEALLEVMDDTGPWRLELRVPEHRQGHLLRAREKRSDPALPVTFVLATNPETTWTGTLGEVATRADSTEQQERVVEAFVEIPEGTPSVRRIGADVRCRINCGKRSLAYVMFGDVLEFLQRRFWW